ncbi:tetratricopeptide repeat protein [Kiritimatiellaeota bacterium B1221]|nr:tetratricopeptide repeat protein [Kiritimatiellaeota bacterium B1221]
MKQILFKIIFFPLDLLYFTADSCIVTWRMIKRLLKKKKQQRCHFCQGESNQEDDHPVRSVLKYQNKWMVTLLTPCVYFKKVGKRTLGFCKNDGYMTRPPVWVPFITVGMICFWVFGSYLVLRGFSSDPDNFGKNFVSTFAPSTLGEEDENVDFLNQTAVRLNPERAERYFLSGLKYFDQGKYPNAQVDFKIAIQENPTEANYHFHLAKAYRVMGQEVKAIGSIEDTLEYDPEHVEAMLLLAQYMENREDRVEALKLAAKALELEPDNLMAIRMNAGLLAAGGEKEKTRELMDKLYAMDGKNPDTLTVLARLEMSVFQDMETAKARLQAALSLKDDFVPAKLAMISIFVQENQIEKVDATLNEILVLEPDNLEALRLQAEMILNRYGMSAGLRAYTQLLNRFGGNMALRLRYAELLLRAGKISEGKKLAQQITASREPRYERAAHWMLAQMYAQVRMHDEAIQHARSALRLTPSGQNIHLFLSQQLMASEEIGEARREAELALAQNRQDLRAVNLVTQAMVLQDELDQAIALLDGLLEEYPDSDTLRMRRIEILMQSDRWAEALPDTRMLNAKYPDNAPLKNNLAFLLARSGQDLSKAQVLSVELAKAFSDNPIIMDTRAYVMAASGQHEEALMVYEGALAKAGDNVVIRYHYAKSLAALGRANDAVRQLQALLMINPNFPQSQDARTLLESLQGENS